ncbi:hypothetical protein KKI93_18545 [Xenorhabdus bovienii]|nr:hypothetical protein [Xenorhabdus bovienii]MDE9566000.1 hypothetical protein [Xenorhabdus bovienii]
MIWFSGTLEGGMRKILLLTLLILVGCGITPKELRSTKPYAEFSSSKSPDFLSKCIASGLETRSYDGIGAQVYFRPMNNGMSISTFGNIVLIDIFSEDSKTLVKYYSAYTHTWTWGKEGRINAAVQDIKSCI